MIKIPNTQKITKITMKPFAECKCGIGKDWYHIDFDIAFIPGKYYPDYMDVSRFISENINGAELNIEEAVYAVEQFLNAYEPNGLMVTANVNFVTTHCPVTVTKYTG